MVIQMTDRNLGKFYITDEAIRQNPDKIAVLFSLLKIVPVRAEYIFCRNSIEYIAIGIRFEEVPLGQEIPEYKIEIGEDRLGNIDLVEVIKIDKKEIL